jgi:hypothetical protein
MIWISTVVAAQQQTRPQTSERQAGAQEPLRTAEASRVEKAPRLDGTLDDPLWRDAKPISNFLQREPFEGQEPTEKTEVRILYSKHEVYFGIVCYDSVPTLDCPWILCHGHGRRRETGKTISCLRRTLRIRPQQTLVNTYRDLAIDSRFPRQNINNFLVSDDPRSARVWRTFGMLQNVHDCMRVSAYCCKLQPPVFRSISRASPRNAMKHQPLPLLAGSLLTK